MMQRICSSIEAGRSTARKMLDWRKKGREGTDDDADLLEEIEDFGAEEFEVRLDREAVHLENVLDVLESAKGEDPKGRAVLHYLETEGWLELGCIVFSQYHDTARWIGNLIGERRSEEPVAVYAGAGKSGINLGGNWRSLDRQDIKAGVRERRIRIVCATDAACEGLNLQTLGTMINIDLPWNPSRLEQRIGRIKRYGQSRESVDMANLVYAGTVDETVYGRLSERMKDRYDILGSLPDTIEADWIDDLETVEKRLKEFTRPRSPAEDVFSVRYGESFGKDGDDREWETWTKVVSRHDIERAIMRSW